MTLEQYEARIKELENENMRLKNEIINKRNNVRKKHPLLPQSIRERYINECGADLAKSTQFRHLSAFVRMVVFQPSSVPSKRKHNSNYPEPILFSEMSDEQYETYCELMDKITTELLVYRDKNYYDLTYLILNKSAL